MLAARVHRLAAAPKTDQRTFDLLVQGRSHTLRPATNGTASDDSSLTARVLRGLAILGDLGLAAPNPATNRCSLVLLPAPDATGNMPQDVTLVFGGNNSEFALPVGLLARPDTHLVLIRDPRRCFGLAGVSGLGETYDDCLAGFDRILSALGGGKLFVMAVSAGAAGGLRFACDLAAQGFLGFSVPTTLNLDDDPGAELRHYPQLTMLYRHDRSLGIDLAKYYAAMRRRPEAMLVFSREHIRDSWLAGRMANIPGVELIPTKGFEGHTTYHYLTMERLIEPLFDRLYERVPFYATDLALAAQ